MSRTITIELSETMFEYLERAAQLAHQSVDEIIESSLAHSLPPLLEEIPAPYQAAVFPLLQMDDTELAQQAHQHFPRERWTEYERLLTKKKEQTLNSVEQETLDRLHREADVLEFRKGYANVLLKRRGYPLPSLSELTLAE
jgi:hypothetical protein